ncbi:MAG: EAL domain-containing protein [Eggerthellaceae bacterium]|uniref:EAL domain-containing protein n=2 Tax=Gordonibacter urolithinfaciens TaxID=1335613 RepID=A0A7K0IB26_9ACTN|nr:EAL domain-containing protein [Gordonibacter urolithinfaciens]MBS6975619.1 EAL domain-containing protein [Eggerthellaceae bacterium]MSA95294.1 EAL domain-containing protein [Gordonibacter urolithinfaciens]
MGTWNRKRLVGARRRRGGGSSPVSDHDTLSGLLSRSGFDKRVRMIIDGHPNESYLLVYGDIDRFKVYNDLFGAPAGDRLLADIGAMIRDLMPAGAAAARLRADHFVCCCSRSSFDPDRMLAALDAWFASYREDFTFFVRLGIFPIDDPSLDVNLMCDRALLALRSAKSGYVGSKYVFYDEKLRSSVLKEQELAGEMIAALEGGQFVPYFQPQYRYATGRMIGAEVLARWNHPAKGLLGPTEFIPVFERNGLVATFDYYMWEQACRCLRMWIDGRGIEGAPRLSVNLSRADIYRSDLCTYLEGLIERYDVPAELLHLEITESAYMEAPEQLIGAVTKLRAAGFVVEMDDFGSGYSSLNTLKDVPVDVLKLDMGFLGASASSRGGLILASVVRMARWLDLPLIAEGVETKQQAAYLASVGCDYMQGYLFSKPVDRETFEKLLEGTAVEDLAHPFAESLQDGAAEFWDVDSQLSLIFNSYAGPAAIAEYDGETCELIRVNGEFARLLDLDDEAASAELVRKNFLGVLQEEDRAALEEALRAASEGDAACDLRYRSAAGKGRWLRLHLRPLSRTDSVISLYVLAEETTEEQVLRDRLAAPRDSIPGGLQRLRRQNEARQQLYDAIPCGIVRYTVGDGQHIVSINKKGCELLGYRDREEFIASSGDNALMPIHEDDVPRHRAGIERLRNGSKPLDFAYRYYRSDGTVGWLEGTSAYELGPEGEPMIQSAFLDVSGRRRKSHELDLQRFTEVLCSVYDEIFEFDRMDDRYHVLYSALHPESIGVALPLEEALGRWMAHIPDGVERAGLRKTFDECRANVSGKPSSCTYKLSKGGNATWCQSTFIRVSDTCTLCCNKDVTEGLATEDRRRAWQDERYRLLTEMTNKMSFDYDSDTDTVLLYIDRTGDGVEAQVIPHYLEKLASARSGVVHPDDMDDVRRMFEDARAGAAEVSAKYRANYYGHGYAWYRANLFVAHDNAGAWHLVGLIENIEDERDLRYRAENDAATGLSNHATTQDLVAAALAKPAVREHSVCVVLDIDDFKAVNDNSGHMEGDALLRKVGSVLRSSFRESDVIGRVGGDEFVLLLKEVDMDVVLRKLNQVRAQISATTVPGLGHAPTLSVGVYATCSDDRTYRDVFTRADEALYQAKRAGKNRIQVYGS